MSDNYVTGDGLTLQSRTEIVEQLKAQLQAIYGEDINLDSNSPDGQAVEIYAQAKIDLLDCMAQIYNSFSPETATGRLLDMRCAINGVIRKGPTYTVTNITVTTNKVVTLSGLDTAPTNPYTVADTAANRFYLQETAVLAIGANVLSFQAAESGLVETTIGTITSPITIVLGVVSVNNPTSAITIGRDEETDAELRFRRQESVSLPSQGWIDAIIAAIKSLDNVTDAVVYENITGTTDIHGVPGHSMWAIVANGADADIAEVIYRKRNAGCGMKGTEEVTITQVDGNPFTVKFDRPIPQDLYITVNVESMIEGHVIDEAYLRQELQTRLSYGIYQPADLSHVSSLIIQLDPLAVVSSGGVSGDNVTFTGYVYPDDIQSKFTLDVNHIVVNVL